MKFIATLLMMVVFATGHARAQVGFQVTSIADASGQKLDVGIWYPSNTAATRNRLGPYSQEVAPDAPIAGSSLPMVLISHGSGGWFGGHSDTAVALANAGFIVAAVTHKGDSSDDASRRAEIWIRPPQLKSLTDFMLAAWPDHARIDANRIGVFGFSSGGFTALVAVGGTPRLDRVLTYCKSHPDTQTCGVLKSSSDALKTLAVEMPAATWMHDPRIKAAVVAAPALGFTFTREGLSNVRIPVQLWRAADDRVLPYADYADAVRAALPKKPEFHIVVNAGHYDFMTPCPAGLASEVPEIYTERPGFDRARFNIAFNESVVRFFRRSLPRAR